LADNKEIVKIFGVNLRKFRHAKGLSQRGLFALSGIDNAMICRMENGEVNVTLNTLATLADALGVSVSELVKKEEIIEEKEEL
jgi:transcriptional regulator with XRE-family HTH domain